MTKTTKQIPALVVIEEKLLGTGMSQEEVDFLISRFLQEEAFTYVECVQIAEEKAKEQVILH